MIEGEEERGSDVVAHGVGGGGGISIFEGFEDFAVLVACELDALRIVDATVCEEDACLELAFLDGSCERAVAGALEDGAVKGEVGVEELDQDKLPALLRLRYDDSLDDALDDLGGDPEAIGGMFKGFQRHLYQHAS